MALHGGKLANLWLSHGKHVHSWHAYASHGHAAVPKRAGLGGPKVLAVEQSGRIMAGTWFSGYKNTIHAVNSRVGKWKWHDTGRLPCATMYLCKLDFFFVPPGWGDGSDLVQGPWHHWRLWWELGPQVLGGKHRSKQHKFGRVAHCTAGACVCAC
eukprot:scaffold1565_cov19-Tisochrysis_lutea.AAC.1